MAYAHNNIQNYIMRVAWKSEISKFHFTAQNIEGSVELTWQNCLDLEVAGIFLSA